MTSQNLTNTEVPELIYSQYRGGERDKEGEKKERVKDIEKERKERRQIERDR